MPYRVAIECLPRLFLPTAVTLGVIKVPCGLFECLSWVWKGCFNPLRSLDELSKFRVDCVNVCQRLLCPNAVTLWVTKVPCGWSLCWSISVSFRWGHSMSYKRSKWFMFVAYSISDSVLQTRNLIRYPGRNPLKNILCLNLFRWRWRESSCVVAIILLLTSH